MNHLHLGVFFSIEFSMTNSRCLQNGAMLPSVLRKYYQVEGRCNVTEELILPPSGTPHPSIKRKILHSIRTDDLVVCSLCTMLANGLKA
jgi:hypothetical protein